jgi:hypothetical protein
MYQLFGAKMDTLLDELNEVLVAWALNRVKWRTKALRAK